MWTFMNPTEGTVTLEEIADEILKQVERHPGDRFRLMIGTDSQPKNRRETVTFVSAIIIHHVGKGARYYIHREQQHRCVSLRQRMFSEAAYSLELGGLLSEYLHQRGADCNLEVHLDIGERGETKQIINEIVNWITANGFKATIKPDSYCASKVADRYTKN
jgi:predicted RNase H-related nuclease YkuK (DUF458 family)